MLKSVTGLGTSSETTQREESFIAACEIVNHIEFTDASKKVDAVIDAAKRIEEFLYGDASKPDELLDSPRAASA